MYHDVNINIISVQMLLSLGVYSEGVGQRVATPVLNRVTLFISIPQEHGLWVSGCRRSNGKYTCADLDIFRTYSKNDSMEVL